MSYRCGPADWIDLAVGRLEDAKRSLRVAMLADSWNSR